MIRLSRVDKILTIYNLINLHSPIVLLDAADPSRPPVVCDKIYTDERIVCTIGNHLV